MLKKLTSITLVAVLFSLLSGTSALASKSSDLVVNADEANASSAAPAKQTEKPNEQLRNNMLKLVADAKSGRVIPAAKSQIQPARSNNLSAGKKIAIGVGITAAVIAVILIVKSPALNDGQ